MNLRLMYISLVVFWLVLAALAYMHDQPTSRLGIPLALMLAGWNLLRLWMLSQSEKNAARDAQVSRLERPRAKPVRAEEEPNPAFDFGGRSRPVDPPPGNGAAGH
jgi:hypothetical protein